MGQRKRRNPLLEDLLVPAPQFAFPGVIPPPALLEHYERISPGAANRILTQFEEQGRHRRKLENQVIWNNVVGGILGQLFGFLLMVSAVGLGGFLIYSDKPVAGLASIISAVGGAAYVLRRAEMARREDLARKREARGVSTSP